MSSCTVCYDLEPSSEHPSNGYIYKISDIQNASYHGCKTCKLLLDSCIGLLGESFASLDYNIKIRLRFGREPHFQTENFVIWGFGMGCTHVKPSEKDCPWAGNSLEPAKGCCVNLDDYIHFIRANLAICASSHKLCSSISASKTSYTPTRLVRVSSFEQDLILVETFDQGKAYGDYCNYVALSHCWGRHQPAKTTKATLDRYKSRLIWTDLPKTFQDAITVTRALGIDFIWVDSLCIIQDDPDDWAKEASQMASIYRNAYIIIAATSAAGGEEGFLCDRRRRIYKSTAEVNGKIRHFFTRCFIDHSSFSRPDMARLSRPLPLITRGWCLQEQILSPHVVHFTSQELMWECHDGVFCECSGKIPGSYIKMEIGKIFTSASPTGLSKTWTKILEQYCQRQLTFPKDRLPALSGVAEDFDRHGVMGSYLAGHWERDLPFSLLWVSKASIGRRETRPAATSSLSTKSSTPSWSWASLEAADMSWQRWVPELESEVQILEASSSPNTADLRGQVSEGHITFRGQVFVVEVAEYDPVLDCTTLRHRRPFTTNQGSDANPVECFFQGDVNIIQTPAADEVLLFLVLASRLKSESGNRSFSGIYLLASERPACYDARKLKDRTGCDYVAVRIGAGALNSAADHTTSTTRIVTII